MSNSRCRTDNSAASLPNNTAMAENKESSSAQIQMYRQVEQNKDKNTQQNSGDGQPG